MDQNTVFTFYEYLWIVSISSLFLIEKKQVNYGINAPKYAEFQNSVNP